MAETNIKLYSASEKLNRMAVDLITVTLTTDAEAIGDNEIIAQSIEIPNAVSINGGSAIIQSAILLDEDDEAPAVDLVFSSANTALGSDDGEAVSITDANARNIQGFVNVSSYTDLIGSQVAVKSNIGLAVKTASDSKSLYVHCINRSGGTYTPAATTDMKLKIGFIRS